MRCVAGVLDHGAEFPLIERFSVAPSYSQLEKHIAWGIKRYAKCDQCENRSQDNKAEQGQSKIEDTLQR
jgi:hypothetical protein